MKKTKLTKTHNFLFSAFLFYDYYTVLATERYKSEPIVKEQWTRLPSVNTQPVSAAGNISLNTFFVTI